MTVMEARAVISGIDKTGAAFASAAKNLKGFQSAAKSFTGINFGWSSQFDKELERMRLSARQFKQVQTSWTELHQKLSGLPLRFGQYADATAKWETMMTGALRHAGSDFDRLTRSAQRFGAVVAGLIAARPLQRIGKFLGKEGAELQHEKSLDWLSGVTEPETKRFADRAMELSSRYRSIDAATMHQSLRETATGLRDPEKAMALSETLARGLVILQALKGRERAVPETSQFMRALNTMGINDPKDIAALYSGYIKALATEGRELNMGGILQMVRQARAAGSGLSAEFLMTIAPQLQQDMGDARSGTAISSAIDQLVGKKSSKGAIAAQRRLGLRDRRGRMLGQDLLQANPFDWSEKYLVPALIKRGVNVDNPGAVNAALSEIMPNRTAKDMFEKFVSQRKQYGEGKAWYENRAKGLEAAEALSSRDPYAAMSGLQSAIENFAGKISEPAVKPAITGLNLLSDEINRFTQRIAENPVTQKAAGAATLAAGGAAVWTAGAAALRFLNIARVPLLGWAGPYAIGAPFAAAAVDSAGVANGWSGYVDNLYRNKGRFPAWYGNLLPDLNYDLAPNRLAPLTVESVRAVLDGTPIQAELKGQADIVIRVDPSDWFKAKLQSIINQASDLLRINASSKADGTGSTGPVGMDAEPGAP